MCGHDIRAKDKIAIYEPKHDGTFIIEFKTAEGDALAISVPRSEAAALKHFKRGCPTGS